MKFGEEKMKKYRRRPEIVEVVQWFKPGDHPEVFHKIQYSCELCLHWGDEPCCNFANKTEYDCIKRNDSVVLRVYPSNYILTYPDGHLKVKTQEEMNRDWEEVEGTIECAACNGWRTGKYGYGKCDCCLGTGRINQP
jgi:hypothetical protein